MRRRRLNVKLLAWLGVGGITCFVGVFFLHTFQVRSQADALYELADQSREAGDLKKSANYLRQYVKFRPDDAEGYAAWASTLTDIANLPEATRRDLFQANSVLESAVRKAPERDDIRRRLVDFAMKIGRWQDAKDHLDVLIASDKNDPELKLLYARCLTVLGNIPQAAQQLYRLIGYDPRTKTFDPKTAEDTKSIDVYVAAAYLERQYREAPEVADQIMQQMVAVNPNSFQAYLQRGRYLQRRGELQRAQEDISQALELEPDDAEVILTASELAIDQKRYELAADLLARGVQRYAHDERMYQTLASLSQSQSGDLQGALEKVRAGLKAVPASRALMASQANLQLQLRDLDAARATKQAMKEAGFEQVWLDYLQARIDLVAGKWIVASRSLERLRPLMIQQAGTVLRIDLLLGQCYENMGQSDRALEAYRRALGADARLAMAREGVRRTTAALGQSKKPASSDTLQGLIRKVMQLPKESRDWSRVDTAVETFIRKQKLTEPRQEILWAQVLMLREDQEAALNRIKSALNKFSDDLTVWLAATSLVARIPDQGLERALRLIERATQHVGRPVSLRLAHGMLLLRAEQPNLKSELGKLEIALGDLSSDDQNRFWLGMGGIYQRANLPAEARRCWQQVARQRPNDLPIRLRLFKLARQQDDDAQMRQTAAEILKLVGSKKDSVWQFCEAARLVSASAKNPEDSSLLKRAQELLSMALDSRPQWHELHRLQGALFLLDKEYDAAIDSLSRALELAPADSALVKQLVRVLSMRGRFQEAQEALQLLGSRKSEVLPELQAEIYLRTGESNEALQMAREAIDRDPENALKHLWYGQVLLRANQPKAAEVSLRRAVEIAPKVPEFWLALVGYLVATDQTEQAEAALKKLKAEVPQEHQPLLLARCFEILGRFDQAEQQYQASLSAAPKDLSRTRALASFYLNPKIASAENLQKATALLKQILNAPKTGKQTPEIITWARRSMARLLASQGAYPDLLKAMALIEANQVGGHLRQEDRLLAATILAARPEAVSRRKAIRLLQEIQAKQGLGLREQLILAQLYRRADDWPKCRAQMLEVLGSFGSNKAVLAMYCRMLLDQGLVDQAQRWVRKLVEVAPTGDDTLRIRAGLLVAQGKSDQATELLLGLLPDPIEQKDLRRLVTVATWLEQLNLTTPTEKLLRRFVELEPRGQLAMAQFLGRHGDAEEAFEILRSIVTPKNRIGVIQSAIITVRSQRATIGSRFDKQIESWLDMATRDPVQQRGALLQRASLRDVQGRHQEEEQIYRQLLERDDLTNAQRTLALNNLAFNLAMRDRGAKGGMQLVKDAIEINGPTGALLDTRAMVSLSMGETERAISDLNLAISDVPKPTRYFHLALAQLAAGDKKSARSSYLEAKRRGLKVEDVSKLERPKLDHLVREIGISPTRRAG